MDPTTLTALRASIAHWGRIVIDPINEVIEGSNGALCIKFNYPSGSGCDGCPVYSRTGEKFCGETPAGIFEERWIDLDGEETFEDIRDLRCLAAAELDFLKSLLPADAA